MATSNLYRTGEAPAQTGKGHGTDALGPSDSSDSGSDLVGADLGNASLDSDTDSTGTGERRAAGHEPVTREDGDVMPDSVRDLNDPAVDLPIDDNAFEYSLELANERDDSSDDADAPDAAAPETAPTHPKPGTRDLPLRSPTRGTNWPDDMRRSRPTYKGRRVPGQHRG